MDPCPFCTSKAEKLEELVGAITEISESVEKLADLIKDPENFERTAFTYISHIRAILVKTAVQVQLNEVKVEPQSDEEYTNSSFDGFSEKDPLSFTESSNRKGIQKRSQVPVNLSRDLDTCVKIEYDDDEDVETIDTHNVQQTDTYCSTSLSMKPKHKKKANRDGKPPGRMTAYSYYVQVCWNDLKKKTPPHIKLSTSFSEISKQCSAGWQKLTKEEKDAYYELSRQDHERFKNQMKDYHPTGKRRGRPKRKEGAPKRPLTAFFWFSTVERASVREALGMNGCTVANMSKELSRRWTMASNETKIKFETMALMDKERYASEIQSYNKNQWETSKGPQTESVEATGP